MSRVKWKNQFTTITSASKFHNRVREILATDPIFKNFRCYQEVAVHELVDGYPHHNHHYDWYIEELLTVIELHGAQHYGVVNYGNIGWEDAERQFQGIQELDSAKKYAALDAGFKYVEIHYKNYPKLDGQLLRKLVFGGS